MNRYIDNKILVIGVGSIGKRHIKNLSSLGFLNLAVYDPQVKSLSNLKVYKNLTSAFSEFKPAVVFVCSPTREHIKQVGMALDWGCDVFCEKPISFSVNGIDDLIRKVEKKKKIVMVGCNWRFQKSYARLARLIKDGKYGKVLYSNVSLCYYLPSARVGKNYKEIYAAKKYGGGVILDSGSHVLDYLVDLFGPVQNSSIFVSQTNVLKIDTEEIAHIVLKHNHNILSFIMLDYISKKPIHKIRIVCEGAVIKLDFREDLLKIVDDEEKILYRGTSDLNGMFVAELKYFFACLKNRSEPIQNLAKARNIVQILTRSKRIL